LVLKELNYATQGAIAIAQQKKPLISPLPILDKIRDAAHPSNEWDLADCGVSAFSYLSILGSGAFIPIMCFIVQSCFLLVIGYDAFFPSVDEDGKARDSTSLGCPNAPQRAKLIIFAVALFYLIKVVPDLVAQFYSMVGNESSTFSRLMSLRSGIHLKGEDTLLQMLGFNLEILMNGGATSLTLMLNLYLLMSTVRRGGRGGEGGGGGGREEVASARHFLIRAHPCTAARRDRPGAELRRSRVRHWDGRVLRGLRLVYVQPARAKQHVSEASARKELRQMRGDSDRA
jgi:hypothetical protein